MPNRSGVFVAVYDSLLIQRYDTTCVSTQRIVIESS